MLTSPPPEVFCKQVANYFIKKVSDLRLAIDTLPPSSELNSLSPELVLTALNPVWPIFHESISDTPKSHHSIPAFTQFQSVSASTIKQIILTLGPASSVLDPVPTFIIKQLIEELLPDITTIINTSLSTGEVPLSWKTGVITPLLKKAGADVTNFKNLRPITQLCILPRIIEAIAVQQLQNHLETHGLLHDYQSGFRPSRGTESATLDIREQMLWGADANHPSLLILLDLSAAFDTVDHAILLQRLAQVAGIRGVALRWLGSFLSDRHQLVKWQDRSSERAPVPWGVPQGSSLSPLLFNIYLRPLAALLEVCGLRFQMFADDTQILVNLHKSSPDRDKLVPCLVLLQEWMRLNKLRLNPDKTELLVAGPAHQDLLSDIPWPRSWGPMPVPVQQARNLGVEFSHNLGGEAHAHKTARSCHHQLNSLARLFPLLGLRQKVILYQALIGSRIRYGLIHLLGAPQKTIFIIQRVQNRAIRLIFQLDRRAHLSSWREKLGWLTVENMIKEKAWLTVENMIKEKACHVLWKAKCKTGPTYLQKWAGLPKVRRLRRTINIHRSCLPKYSKSRKGGRTLAVAGAKIWNTLPASLHHMKSWPLFRRSLKQHFLTVQSSLAPLPSLLHVPVQNKTLTGTSASSTCPIPPVAASVASSGCPSLLSFSTGLCSPSLPIRDTGFLPTGLCSPPLPTRDNGLLTRHAHIAKRLNTSMGGTYAPRTVH